MRSWSPYPVLAVMLLGCAPARGIDLSDPDWKWALPGWAGREAVSFRSLDKDRNRQLTQREIDEYPVLVQQFLPADADGDGKLSPIEFNNAAARLDAKDDDWSLVPGRLGFSVVERQGGIVVSAVGAGSPAARAGVRVGDVVVRYSGAAVSGARQLYRRMLDSFPGSVVTLEVLRAGAPQRFSIRVDAIDTTPPV